MKKTYTDNYVFIRIHMERFHVANSQSSRGVEVIQQLQPFGNGQRLMWCQDMAGRLRVWVTEFCN